MRKEIIPCIAGATFILIACKPEEKVTPPPAHASATLVALTGAALLVGAGDIARCGSRGDERVAILLDSVLKADSAAGVPAVAFYDW